MANSDSSQSLLSPPESILIIGAGVFGISTAHALLKNERYDQTVITVVDAYAPDPETKHGSPGELSADDITASLDTSRIVRPDYTDPLYAKLADEAAGKFRSGWAEGIDAPERTYTQPGLVLISSGPKDGRAREYLRKTYENTLRLAQATESKQELPQSTQNSGSEPILLPTSRDVEKVLVCTPGSLPELVTGYINPQAGWANASAAISAVKHQVLSLGRAREAQGKGSFRLLSGTKVSSLLFSEDKRRVIGANLSTDEQLHATITILATGAWTSCLLPSLFAPRLRASGQVLAYITMNSAEEVSRYAGRPTVMDMDTGMFIIYPPEHYITERRETGHLKVARHGWGYSHSLIVEDPVTSRKVECCLPLEDQNEFFTVPAEGRDACRRFAQLIVPELSERGFSFERICWYTDTPTSDFLIEFAPGLDGVLLATGGSGHGFKFLPVIGERIIARLEGKLEAGLADLWRWRSEEECELLWKGASDESRGGERGLIWSEEINRNNA